MKNQERNENKNPNDAGEMSLLGHLAELRRRLIISLLTVGFFSALCYSNAAEIFYALAAPYLSASPSAELIGTGHAEAFILKLKVAVFAGILLSSPILFQQTWLFIAPGLYESEKKLALPFIFISTVLFIFGVSFCYLAVLPVTFNFFYSEYVSIGVKPNIRISEHLSLVLRLTLGFGAIFEVPVLAYFLGRLGIVTDKQLISSMRYAVVIIFIISAILTPPDVLTQFLMAGPLLLLYGASIFVVRFAQRGRSSGSIES